MTIQPAGLIQSVLAYVAEFNMEKMSRRVYLDNNASTPMDSRVAEQLSECMTSFGNPSSIHSEGREARALIDNARVSIGKLIGCDHKQILFTSGGTEANNLAILGTGRANKARGNHVITSAIEHSSVLQSCKQLGREGFDVTYVKPSPAGCIDPSSVEKAIRPETILVTIMLANNEIGTLQPIPEIAQIAHRGEIDVHTDAVQGLGKIPLNIAELGIDLLSVSAHKIYGPKGAGALYCSSDISLFPLVHGGSHEKGFRAGTENVPGIHAFGFAAELLVKEGLPNLMPLRQRLEDGLSQMPMTILCRETPRLPNTVNFYCEDWLGESMVMALDLEGIAVSNGSACSAGVIEPSHVISALGYNDLISRSVIRVSLGKFTEMEDIDYFLGVIHDLWKGRTAA